MSNKLSPGDRVSVDAGLGITKTGNVQRITESTVFVKHYNGAVVGYRTQHVTKMLSEEVSAKPRGVGLKSEFDAFMQVMEKTLTPAELKKREEVAKAMERENPDMPMDKKMAIATATAKKVAEEAEQIDELSQDTLKSYVKKVADDAMKHPMNPTKRPAEKASKSVTGFSKALNRLPPEKFFNKEETKPHTVPKTAKEKDLAALAEPKDKITHADVMVGRGVKKEEISTAQMGHAGKTTIKHIKNPTVTQRMAAHDVKPGVAGYRDRIALLKAAQAQGNLKEEQISESSDHKRDADEYKKEGLMKAYHRSMVKHFDSLADNASSHEEEKRHQANADKHHALSKTAVDTVKAKVVDEDTHYCAKHVFSERFGEGMVVEGQHAEPNEQGLIEWYDVDFGGIVRRVMTEKVKVMHAEYHMNHKKKMKEEDEIEEMSSKEKMKRGLYNKEEIELDEEQLDELSSDLKSRYKQAASRSLDQAQDFKSELDSEGVPKKSPVRKDVNRIISNRKMGIKRANEEVELEEAIENLPGKATHLTNKDIRHPEHGIIAGSTTLRHLDGNKYEVRAGRARGKTVELDKQHVQKLSMEEVELDEEQLDELSTSTLQSYRDQTKEKRKAYNDAIRSVGMSGKEDPRTASWAKEHDRLGGKMKIAARKIKQNEEVVAEAMISYSDFQSKIDSHRKAGNQIKDDKYDKKKASYTVVDQEGTAKKITHTDAGVSQQHLGSMKRDDSDDKSAETKPKETRGRGRPTGSKSGARN